MVTTFCYLGDLTFGEHDQPCDKSRPHSQGNICHLIVTTYLFCNGKHITHQNYIQREKYPVFQLSFWLHISIAKHALIKKQGGQIWAHVKTIILICLWDCVQVIWKYNKHFNAILFFPIKWSELDYTITFDILDNLSEHIKVYHFWIILAYSAWVSSQANGKAPEVLVQNEVKQFQI